MRYPASTSHEEKINFPNTGVRNMLGVSNIAENKFLYVDNIVFRYWSIGCSMIRGGKVIKCGDSRHRYISQLGETLRTKNKINTHPREKT